MKQRDIYLANLNPIKKGEQAGIRPVVVVSGDTMNDNLGVTIICPLTSVIKNYPGTVIIEKNSINKLTEDSEGLVFQIRTISQKRLTKKLGKISKNDFKEIINSLNDVLFL